jgi:hypothetical protein
VAGGHGCFGGHSGKLYDRPVSAAANFDRPVK